MILLTLALTLGAADALDTLRDAGAAGPAEVRLAWRETSRRSPETLVPILRAMDGADLTSANWLRTAYEAILAAHPEPETWPTAELLRLAADESLGERPRRLALGTVERARPGTRASFVSERLDDPAFRDQATAQAAATAERLLGAGKRDEAVALLRRALAANGEFQQASVLARALERLGEPVDRIGHLGVLTRWYVVGPFDGAGMTALGSDHPVQQDAADGELRLSQTYEGKNGSVRWRQVDTSAKLSPIDFTGVLGKERDAFAYAFTVVRVPRATQAVLRLGADDAVRVWVGGAEAYRFDQYYQPFLRPDLHEIPVTLPAGATPILVKVAIDAVNPDLAEVPSNWQLLARLTDAEGKALEFGYDLP